MGGERRGRQEGVRQICFVSEIQSGFEEQELGLLSRRMGLGRCLEWSSLRLRSLELRFLGTAGCWDE